MNEMAPFTVAPFSRFETFEKSSILSRIFGIVNDCPATARETSKSRVSKRIFHGLMFVNHTKTQRYKDFSLFLCELGGFV
jgi:hypothetical protein